MAQHQHRAVSYPDPPRELNSVTRKGRKGLEQTRQTPFGSMLPNADTVYSQ